MEIAHADVDDRPWEVAVVVGEGGDFYLREIRLVQGDVWHFFIFVRQT